MQKASVFICLLSLFFCACGEYEILEHNKRVNKSVDSLYRVKRDSLKTHADSICNLLYDDFYSKAVDSISVLRIKEIEELIEK